MYLVSDQTFIKRSVRKCAYLIGQPILPKDMDTHVNMRGCKSSKMKTIPFVNKVQDGPNNYNIIEIISLINLSCYPRIGRIINLEKKQRSNIILASFEYLIKENLPVMAGNSNCMSRISQSIARTPMCVSELNKVFFT